MNREIGKTSALSSGNDSKYIFLTDEDVSPEYGLLEKAVTIKKTEYLLLENELENQACITEK